MSHQQNLLTSGTDDSAVSFLPALEQQSMIRSAVLGAYDYISANDNSYSDDSGFVGAFSLHQDDYITSGTLVDIKNEPNSYVIAKYGSVVFDASDMIIINLTVFSISLMDYCLIVWSDIALASIRGVIISFCCNFNVCFNMIKHDQSNRISAASDCVDNVYGHSSAFHSVSYHTTSELIMYLFHYNITFSVICDIQRSFRS